MKSNIFDIGILLVQRINDKTMLQQQERKRNQRIHLLHLRELDVPRYHTSLFAKRNDKPRIEDLDIGSFLGVRLALETVSFRSRLDCQRFNGCMTDSLSDTVREVLADSSEYGD